MLPLVVSAHIDAPLATAQPMNHTTKEPRAGKFPRTPPSPKKPRSSPEPAPLPRVLPPVPKVLPWFRGDTKPPASPVVPLFPSLSKDELESDSKDWQDGGSWGTASPLG